MPCLSWQIYGLRPSGLQSTRSSLLASSPASQRRAPMARVAGAPARRSPLAAFSCRSARPRATAAAATRAVSGMTPFSQTQLVR